MGKHRKRIGDLESDDEEIKEIERVMGFKEFKSSKNEDHSESSAEYASQFKATRKFSVQLHRRSNPKPNLL